MKIQKKVISNLKKCYSIAPLHYNKKDYILVAAEKTDRCLMFDLDGNQIDEIWSEPGGTMSMVQIPGSNGQFLATHKFYSPNDSKEAKIVVVTPQENGEWDIHTLVCIPHVHRFDLLTSNGKVYLIACALKSGHEYKDDWSMPGKVLVAELPEDLKKFNDENQLELEVLKDNMLKNHGYCRHIKEGTETAIVTCEEGVFRFTPPSEQGDSWEVETLLEEPTSDAVLVDLDLDGQEELCTFSPFHGELIKIYKEENGTYVEQYQYPESVEFTHAIYGGDLCGKPAFVAGHRQGNRNLFAISYDKKAKTYVSEIIDENCGPANVYHFVNEGKDRLIAANREIDEIALYTIER
ncbi:hypothetical protein LJC18_05315 [Lachnospiraceae bacterium OttesenSCG-928-E19]|nr:hypothetical protein [Lachnospiraceae bacterium OttesenSCG-928-E19]